ncbi:MAG: orotidine-5'-phosphate decarboxylase [Dehalococcoidia bacterium]|nr:orotidine-5'-phosphate decarboxylase [Dehalococcoidia bacterium]
MDFFSQLKATTQKNHSLLCVGLDPDTSLLPSGISLLDFNKAIIDATADKVCAYKPNLAFFESKGARGWEILQQTIEYIPREIPVIADAKRGDIGNTSKAYAKAIFEYLGAGAITVSPYLGYDSLTPFTKYENKAVFVLCLTSNQGAADFQLQVIKEKDQERALYQAVAEKAELWNTNRNIGLVVGANYPSEIKSLRYKHPNFTFLVPGIGAQKGDLKAVMDAGLNTSGHGLIINSSRQILYSSREKDFAFAAAATAETLRCEINQYR